MNTMIPTTTDLTPVHPDSAEFHDLVAAVAAAGAARRDRGERAPIEGLELIRAARFGAYRTPRDLGGGGASIRQLVAAVVDLAQADPDVPHILRNHFHFAEQQWLAPPSPDRDRWTAEIVRGALIGNASSERGTAVVGSGLESFGTTLVPESDGYRLTGAKYYSTGSRYSDWVGTLATIDGARLASVLVPADRDGVVLEDDWDGIGQQGTASGTTRFEHVRVERSEVVWALTPEELVGPSYLTAQAQLWLQAVSAGILAAVVDDATNLLRDRARSYSHALAPRPADDPVLHETIGRLASASAAARAHVLSAADALDAAAATAVAGVPDPDAAQEASLRAAQVKVHLDDLAPRAATALFDVGGASAIAGAAGFDRHWRNLRTLASHNPTAYKAVAIGDHLVNGTDLPKNGFF